MQRDIETKWRPPLWLVIACTIFAMLCLPILGILALRDLLEVFTAPTALIATAAGILVASIAVGLVLWRILLRPITTLAARADEIRTGKSDALAPLDHYGTSEMQAMGTAMRQMGQVLQDREAVLRSYADHVTHELKSPLSVVQGAAELLADPDLSAKDRAQMVENVAQASARMKDLLDAQRALARANEPLTPGNCELSDVVQSSEHVEILMDGMIPLSQQAFEPIATHLINNALAHGASKVCFELSGKTLLITDNGSGISQGNRDRVFDPFFTTRRDSGGTGMGLSIVRRMLEAQGATITLVGKSGANFQIDF